MAGVVGKAVLRSARQSDGRAVWLVMVSAESVWELDEGGDVEKQGKGLARGAGGASGGPNGFFQAGVGTSEVQWSHLEYAGCLEMLIRRDWPVCFPGVCLVGESWTSTSQQRTRHAMSLVNLCEQSF